MGYIRMLQFRAQVYCKFRGNDTVVRLFNISSEGAAQPGPAFCPAAEGEAEDVPVPAPATPARVGPTASPDPKARATPVGGSPSDKTPSKGGGGGGAAMASSSASVLGAGLGGHRMSSFVLTEAYVRQANLTTFVKDHPGTPTGVLTNRILKKRRVGHKRHVLHAPRTRSDRGCVRCGCARTSVQVSCGELRLFLGAACFPMMSHSSPTGCDRNPCLSQQDQLGRKPFKGDVDRRRALEELNNARDAVFELEDGEKFAEFVADWETSIAIGQELTSVLNQACVGILSHMAAQKRENICKEKALAAKKQAGELQRVRSEAKRQAEAIREKRRPPTAQNIDPIFLAVFSEIQGVKVVPVLKAPLGESAA